MFDFVRAGGHAAAALMLTITGIGAGPSQALDLPSVQAPRPIAASILPPTSVMPVAPFAPESPQIILPAEAFPIPAVPVPAAPAPVVAATVEAGPVEAPRAPAAPKSRASLAQLVAEHRSTTTPDRERECLAGAIYFESKGEPLPGQVAVGQVILNRAKSGRFPKSWCGVVFQRSQFSFVRGGALPAIPRGSAQWKTAVAVAHIVANDLHNAVVPRALFFHARHVSPRWKLSRLASVGNHVFYR